MLCAVYKTKKKEGMYLYVQTRDNFEAVPEILMEQFGKPELAMMLALDKHEQIGTIAKDALVEALNEKGYYLQMPPKQEDLLAEFRVAKGLSPREEAKKF